MNERTENRDLTLPVRFSLKLGLQVKPDSFHCQRAFICRGATQTCDILSDFEIPMEWRIFIGSIS